MGPKRRKKAPHVFLRNETDRPDKNTEDNTEGFSPEADDAVRQ